MTDSRALIKNILSGNQRAFQTLIKDHQKLVCHIVFRMVSNNADREDLCQEVFIKVYQNLPGFRFESKLSTWIARIAYNTSVSHLEKMKVPLYDDIFPDNESFEEIDGNNILPDRYTENRDVSFRLAVEIDNMPVIYGTVLSLFHLEEMSYNEIGRILQLPEGTIKSYLFRARKLLKNRLMAKYEREEL